MTHPGDSEVGDFFTGGVLTREEAGVLDFNGDFTMEQAATLKLDNDKTLNVSGQFSSVFFAGNPLFQSGGIFDVSNLLIPQDNNLTGFISLVSVGDNTNLLTQDELDHIGVIGLLAGANQRFTELEFRNGIGNVSGWALVEGSGFGSASTIGIAFSNISAVPEPGSFLMLMCTIPMLLRRRRNA